MKIKITFREETKLVSFLNSYQSLVDYTNKVLLTGQDFQLLNFKYVYIDEDDEEITISNEEDFSEAVNTMKDRTYLKITIQELPRSAQTSAQQQMQRRQTKELINGQKQTSNQEKNQFQQHLQSSLSFKQAEQIPYQDLNDSKQFEVIESRIQPAPVKKADKPENVEQKAQQKLSMSDAIKSEVQRMVQEEFKNQMTQSLKMSSSAVVVPHLDDSQVHQGYECNSCNENPIKGPRFTCTECEEEFNLCVRCESETDHDPTHPLLKTKMSEQSIIALKTSRLSTSQGMIKINDCYTLDWENCSNQFQVEVGTKFTKIWRIKNISGFTWSAKKIIVGPADMSTKLAGCQDITIGIEIAHNQSYEIQMNLEAPQDPGQVNYQFIVMIDNSTVPGPPLLCQFSSMVMPSHISTSRILQDMMHVSQSMMVQSKQIQQPVLVNNNATQLPYQQEPIPMIPPKVLQQDQFLKVKDLSNGKNEQQPVPQIPVQASHQKIVMQKIQKPLDQQQSIQVQNPYAVQQQVQMQNPYPQQQPMIVPVQAQKPWNVNQAVQQVQQPQPQPILKEQQPQVSGQKPPVAMQQSVLSAEELRAVEYANRVDSEVQKLEHKEVMMTLLTMGFTDFSRNYDLVRSENGRINYIVHYLSAANP